MILLYIGRKEEKKRGFIYTITDPCIVYTFDYTLSSFIRDVYDKIVHA